MEALFILLLALIIDLALGEPPAVIHPVVWMGKLISWLVKVGQVRSPLAQFIYGLAVVLLTTSTFVTPVYFLLAYLNRLSIWVYVATGALLFKTTFSLRGLRRAAVSVKTLLQKDELAKARFELRALVGRDTAPLDRELLVSAVVESVAENSCDSFVAPVFYFLLFGVPGAVAYRAINTLDAMIGRHGKYEYLGKFAARLDTVVNLIPARISALLVVAVARLCRKSASGAWQTMLRDRRKTESPNAGWPMSAMAGALGVRLEKVGYYRLGDTHNSLSLDTIDASLQIITAAALLWSLLVILAEVVYVAT